MSWFRRKELDSKEYETLLKRLVQAEARLDYLETNEDNLRNLARKIQKARIKPPEENEQNEKPEDLKSKMLLPE